MMVMMVMMIMMIMMIMIIMMMVVVVVVVKPARAAACAGDGRVGSCGDVQRGKGAHVCMCMCNVLSFLGSMLICTERMSVQQYVNVLA